VVTSLFKPELRTRYGLAMAVGLLLAMAFPKFSIAGFAWIAPGLLLFGAAGCAPRRAFRLGYVGGMVYYLVSLYWLLYIPVSFLPILGWIALSAYLGLYPAMWVWLCWKFRSRLSAVPVAEYPWNTELLQWMVGSSWVGRTAWSLQCAALWVALEIVLGRLLSGFPWEFLGVSQYQMLPIIQVAEFTGVYGVSFLIVWFSVSLLLTIGAIVLRPAARSVWAKEIALPLVTLSLVTIFGMSSIRDQPASSETVKIALVQPSIPQTLIWDQSADESRFNQLIELSEEALGTKPEILIWPEASLPNMLRHNEETADAVIGLARKHNVWVILGSDDAERRPGAASLRDIDYFNSAFAVSPEGELTGMYRKRRLVIFGEYVPLVKFLPFLKFLSPAGEAGFTPGTKPVAFNLKSLGISTSILICFEDTFPHLAREYVQADSDFLINLTNNGWFGESAAQWQHAATAAFRAVENRIPLVRCANNGLTCWVDSSGAMHEVAFPDSDNIYKAGFKTAKVPALASGEKRRLTFYTRYGDVFGWSCVAVSLVNVFTFAIRVGGRR
jgi:apolipoprotein N-acyltransferase